ncbi:hypothetical protein ZWY2020_030542 [Hordeum vulgare]|nr:hypothetical protein ZWY2020_030542 [Hordeum vulgare]
MEDTTSQYCYSVYLGWALVVGSLALAVTWRKKANNGLRLPPGPWQLPVIGSLHLLVRQLPHRAMRDLARRHGPVMLLRLGSVPTLVLSSPDAAREVLKTQDLAFATRRLTATMSALTCGGRDMIFAPYGDYWRQLRKIAVTEVLTAGRVRSFRAIREEEVATMLRAIQSAGPVVELRALLSALVADGTFRAVMGNRCDSKQRDLFLHELDRIVRLATGLNTADLWPSSWLAGRLSNALRRAEEIHASVFGIIKDIIHEHLERREEGQGGEDAQEDVLDVLLKIHKDGVIDMVAVEGVVFDIFCAGSETSATTLEWLMAELVKNPAAMPATEELYRYGLLVPPGCRLAKPWRINKDGYATQGDPATAEELRTHRGGRYNIRGRHAFWDGKNYNAVIAQLIPRRRAAVPQPLPAAPPVPPEFDLPPEQATTAAAAAAEAAREEAEIAVTIQAAEALAAADPQPVFGDDDHHHIEWDGLAVSSDYDNGSDGGGAVDGQDVVYVDESD